MLVGVDRFVPFGALVVGFIGTLLMYGLFLTLYRSRRAADEQRLLLDTVLDNLDADVYMKDGARRFRYVNAKGAARLGRPATDLIGRPDTEVMDAAVRPPPPGSSIAPCSRADRQSSAQVAQAGPDGITRQLWSVQGAAAASTARSTP